MIIIKLWFCYRGIIIVVFIIITPFTWGTCNPSRFPKLWIALFWDGYYIFRPEAHFWTLGGGRYQIGLYCIVLLK